MLSKLHGWMTAFLIAGNLLLVTFSLQAGRIVVANDEYPLSDTGFVEPNDAARLAINLATWFVDARPGRFLAISTDAGLTGVKLKAAMTTAGHQWAVTNQAPATLDELKSYDAVFLCATAVPPLLLIDYVNAGGNVYLAGQGLPQDAALWNPFLRRFGLEFTTDRTEGPVDLTVSSSHPLFEGVDHVRHYIGSGIRDVDPEDASSEVILKVGGVGLFALADLRTQRDLESPFLRVSEVEISWFARPNTSYRIEYRSALTDQLWVQLDPNFCVTGDGSIVRYWDRVSIQEPQRFYRVVVADCGGTAPTR